MGIFKVLGGAALGIGVVAAAPVFGAVGAVTAVGAAVGATVGATVASSSGETERVEEARRKGYEKGKAENAKEIEKLKKKFNIAAKRFKEFKEYEEGLVAIFAVAISLAHSDGEFSSEEKEEIEEIIAGVAYQTMPASIKKTIKKLYQEPPTFNEAMEYVVTIDKKHRDSLEDIIDKIIDYMIIVDGVTRPEEVAFKDAWNTFKLA